MQTLIGAEDYQLAFESHTFLAGLCLVHPSETILKPVLEAVALQNYSENVRFRLASAFFVLLWRCDLGAIRKLMTKVEDAAVYLGPDSSDAVKDMLSMAIIMLKSRDPKLSKKCLKLMRKSVVDRIEYTEQAFGQLLIEKLGEVDFDQFNHYNLKKEDGRPLGRGADFKILQICPLLPKEITTYLANVAGEVAQEEVFMSARFTNPFSSTLDDNDGLRDRDRGSSMERDDRINPTYQNELKEKFKRYKSNGVKAPTITEYTEESLTSMANPLRSSAKKSSKNLKKQITDSQTLREENKFKSIEYYQHASRVTDFKVSSSYVSDREKHHGADVSRVPACLISPRKDSFIKSDQNQVRKATRFGDEETLAEAKKDNIAPTSAYEPPILIVDNEEIINDEIRLILEGKGKIIPSKREPMNPNLYNESVIKIIEDIILGAERDDIIKLHAYFSTIFHREPARMTILDNILDMCMYYLTFEHGPFLTHTRIALQVVSEYLRGDLGLILGSNLLGMTLLYAKDLIDNKNDRIPSYLKLVQVVVEM